MSASANETLKKIRGLSEKEVLQARQAHGDNNLARRIKHSFFKEFVRNFGDPIIKILLIALAVNIVIKLRDFDWYESIGIALAILISTLVSTISEYGSESAFEKLQEDALKTRCRVKRREGVCEIPVSDVVAGDFVLLQAGDRIPADGRVYSGELSVDQSPINGESKEAHKSPPSGTGSDFKDNSSLFRGCIVCSGDGIMVVEAVGENTLYGKLAQEIQEPPRESPLKARLGELAGSISKLGYIGAALVAAANLFNSIVVENGFELAAIMDVLRSPGTLIGHLITALTLAISVIVVAIPEGLPLMITVVLSSNMKRMLRDNVLVRRLVGIETSGSLNILFTDKTGTITKGKPEVSAFITGSGKKYRSFSQVKKTELHELLALSSVFNTAAALGTKDGKKEPLGGNATERALLEFVAEDKAVKNRKTVAALPFSSHLKYSAVQLDGKTPLTLVKGAPELVLKNCSHYLDENGEQHEAGRLQKLKSVMDEMVTGAFRLLAIAYCEAPLNPAAMNTNLTLVGIVAIRDEIRREAAKAIKQVTAAGVQVVMITGDNRDTASAIARETGLIKSESKDTVVTSSEINKMTDAELKRLLPSLRVVARAVPSDKSRLVTLAQELGMVTGMTGDGINDAPALKKADVGFAIGSGTEVAREAGDIVILDDNFLSISKAILYGRTIFKSIRKFIIFQLTINFCAVAVSVLGPFIGIDTPITVLQMLWVNMVMDTLAGLAFSGEPPLEEYMKEPPKKRDEPIITRYMLNEIFVMGAYITLLCVLFLKSPSIHGIYGGAHFMTAFFAMFIFAGIFNSFNARTTRLNVVKNITKNRAFIAIMLFATAVQTLIIYFGGTVFRTTGLPVRELQLVLLIAFSVIPADILRKSLINKHTRGSAL